MTETRALVPRQAAEVDTAEVKALAQTYLANKPQGEKVGLFPGNMTPIQATQLARLALMYGLDPMAEELVLYEGKPLVTVDGRRRQANSHPQFDGLEEPREATEQERLAWHLKETEFMFVVRAWRKDRKLPFVGYGRAGGKYERNYLVNNNDRGPELAIKRATVNALKAAFSMPLPSAEDDDHWVEARVIETRTGEIMEPSSRPTDGQIAAIHIAATRLGLIDGPGEDLTYRERLMETCGVESSTDLTGGDAAAFLDMLQRELAEQEAAAERDQRIADEHTMTQEIAATREAAAAKGKRVRDTITLDPGDEAPARKRGHLPNPADWDDEDRVYDGGTGRETIEVPPDAPQATEPAPERVVGPGTIVASGTAETPVYAPREATERITALIGQQGIDIDDVRRDYGIEKGQRVTADQAAAILAWLEKKQAAPA